MKARAVSVALSLVAASTLMMAVTAGAWILDKYKADERCVDLATQAAGDRGLTEESLIDTRVDSSVFPLGTACNWIHEGQDHVLYSWSTVATSVLAVASAALLVASIIALLVSSSRRRRGAVSPRTQSADRSASGSSIS